MARRKTKHRTGLQRIKDIGVKVHDAWIGYICVNCEALNCFSIGNTLIYPEAVYSTGKWKCNKCQYVHSKPTID